MAFFRTRDNHRDPKAWEGARRQRRQQLQAQQQILAALKAEAPAEPEPAE
jgi:hypothetical protein